MGEVARRFDGTRLVIASHNPGKVREIRELLAPFAVEIVSAADMDLPEPEETGTTFVANAELKALAAARETGNIALADDSGFCVGVLDGEPGIYSARWAGPGKDFLAAMERVQALIAEAGHNRSAAWFACALTLAWPDGHTETVEGQVHGMTVWPPRGDRGFGYDPMFLPDGYDQTFGEMTSDDKHGWRYRQSDALSHRARAFKALVERCFDAPG